MLTIACYKVGAVAHPIAMSYEEKELARSLNITDPGVILDRHSSTRLIMKIGSLQCGIRCRC